MILVNLTPSPMFHFSPCTPCTLTTPMKPLPSPPLHIAYTPLISFARAGPTSMNVTADVL